MREEKLEEKVEETVVDEGAVSADASAASADVTAAAGDAAVDEAAASADAAVDEAAAAVLAEKEQEIEALQNRLLRLQADFDNFRRRSQREKEELSLYANEKLLLEFLPVLDNLERALQAGEGPGLLEGVELTARGFREALAKAGVTPIEAVGKPFDPHLHEVMMQVEGESEEPLVVEEFVKGYKLGERVLRPASVKVERQF